MDVMYYILSLVSKGKVEVMTVVYTVQQKKTCSMIWRGLLMYRIFTCRYSNAEA